MNYCSFLHMQCAQCLHIWHLCCHNITHLQKAPGRQHICRFVCICFSGMRFGAVCCWKAFAGLCLDGIKHRCRKAIWCPLCSSSTSCIYIHIMVFMFRLYSAPALTQPILQIQNDQGSGKYKGSSSQCSRPPVAGVC